MKKPKIVSLIKIDGEWVNQDDLPPETVNKIVEATIRQAAKNIGFDVTVSRKENTA